MPADIKMSRISILILATAFLLVNASCSRRAHPAASGTTGTVSGTTGLILEPPGMTLRLPDVTVSTSEKKRLEDFMAAGIEHPVTTGKTTSDAIIETARGYLGVPHCMGGTTAKCMDCSGFVFRVFATNGITLPHGSEEQARYGKIVTEKDLLMPGDLVFFIRTYSTSRVITHSGIYLGDGSFIHASSSQGVTVTSLSDPYWSGRYIFGTRLLD